MTPVTAPEFEPLVAAWTAAVEASHGLLAGITSEAQNEQALAVIDVLLDHVQQRPELDPLLDVVSYLVETFETEAYPIEASPPQHLLAYLMDTRELTSTALADAVGLERREIEHLLAGEEGWTLAHMQTLGAFFHVRPRIFVPDTH